MSNPQQSSSSPQRHGRRRRQRHGQRQRHGRRDGECHGRRGGECHGQRDGECHGQRDDQRGAALILALVILVVLGTVVSVSVDRSRLLTASDASERTRMRALFAADGGLQHARHALAAHPEHRGETFRVGQCEVTTVVAPPNGLAPERRWSVRVEAKALTADQRYAPCRIDAVLRETAHGLPVVEDWHQR